MLDTESGTAAIHAALRPMEPRQVIGYPEDARSCLDRLAPDWKKPLHNGAKRPRQRGWDEVKDDLLKVPEFYRWAGTDDVSWPGGTCRDKGQGDFDPSMALLMRTWLRARDHVASGPALHELDRKMGRRAWLQGGRSRHDFSVCLVAGYPVPETENHSWLILTTKWLHNEWLPPIPEGDVDDHDNVEEHVTDFRYENKDNGIGLSVSGNLDTWLHDDFLEYNARAYSRYQMIGLLNMYDLAKNEAVRAKARAVLDLLAAKAATESMGELRSPPFRRRFENWGKPLFDSDPINPMMQVWVGDLAPYRRSSVNFSGEATLAASSTYRPPDVLTDLMLYPPHRNFHQAFNGRNQHERAYGRPGYVISGGGQWTDCPYPNPAFIEIGGHCPGSGNDSGTIQPILITPRREGFWSPAGGQAGGPIPAPALDSVYHSTNDLGLVIEGNSCIGTGLACAPGFAEGSAGIVSDRPMCRLTQTDPRTKDQVSALLYHRECVDRLDWPKGQCYMVYSRKITAFIWPMTYAVTHDCDGLPMTEARSMFRDFVGMLNRVDNAPSAVDFKIRGLSGIHMTTSIRPPASVSGPVRAGTSSVTLNLFSPFRAEKVTYWLNGDPAWPDTPKYRSAFGSVANIEGDDPARRLVLTNEAAGETVTDHSEYGGASVGQPDIRSVRAWIAAANEAGKDTIRVTMQPRRHPEQGRAGRVRVWDVTNQSVLLAELRQDYTYGRLWDKTPEFVLHPTPGTPGRTYKIESCFWWWRFFTAEDYRNDPMGRVSPAGPSRCVRVTRTIPAPTPTPTPTPTVSPTVLPTVH
ncbi:hypothetical protein OIE66_42355 [Nonomuraea sp. NBC_01738]|uniref:hypothetical protein n=1 Tax=Nonomuraea sp. NBC_01738 TaxID=2976003 RepID=UPI002E159AE1|nr:hypothetical protein OIE66_42355 [Nonomuraea sp. NBC_01738]